MSEYFSTVSQERGLFIGIMSGTSADGIDAVLTKIEHDDKITILNTVSMDFDNKTREAILSLFTPSDNEIEKLGALDVKLAQLYALAVNELLNKTSIGANDISAIGCHGQTIRHRPPSTNSTYPFTLQIGDPNLLAHLTGIATVNDFRRRDVSLGGEGAPLTPAFHQAVFSCKTGEPFQNRCIVNIGGIANITSLTKKNVLGFDTGPGNALMDEWVFKKLGLAFDKDGDFAKKGNINTVLLDQLLQSDYFLRPPPKSTGREIFTLTWLEEVLKKISCQDMKNEDIQATITELTALTISNDIKKYCPDSSVYVCGGGVKNSFLMSRLAYHLNEHNHDLATTKELGIDPQWVEATAFAWLAKQRIIGATGNLPAVTGAKKASVLGGLYLP